MKNEVGGAAAEVLLKFTMVFVIAICAFAVGTFAGKKFTEDQHRLSMLDQNNETSGDRGTASIAPLEVKPSNRLTEEDIRNLTEEFSIAESREIEAALNNEQAQAEALAQKALEQLEKDMKKIEAQKKAKPESSARALASPEISKKNKQAADVSTLVAERLVVNEDKVVVAPTQAERRQPASLPAVQAASAVGKFTVQLASYRTEDEAVRFAEELKSKGYTAFYLEAQVNGQTWYRVSVGMFATQTSANEFMQELYQEAKLKGFVTRVVR